MTQRLPVGAIVAIVVTHNIGHCTLYCSFSILAPDMAASRSRSPEWVFGALSVALAIGGMTAPWLGSLIDRIRAGRVMALGSALSALIWWPVPMLPPRGLTSWYSSGLMWPPI